MAFLAASAALLVSLRALGSSSRSCFHMRARASCLSLMLCRNCRISAPLWSPARSATAACRRPSGPHAADLRARVWGGARDCWPSFTLALSALTPARVHRMYVCMYVCMYACMYVCCVRVCVCVCVCRYKTKMSAWLQAAFQGFHGALSNHPRTAQRPK